MRKEWKDAQFFLPVMCFFTALCRAAAGEVRPFLPFAVWCRRLTDLTFSYPSSYDEVFSHANFQIDTRWKLGLIGRNGRGKTTLLRLLMGEYPYGGSIHSSVEFDYFPYPVPHPQHRAGEVLAALCPQAQPWQIAREISLLDVEEAALERPFSSLSQGEQTKLLLSALFLKEGHFLLIDEPTNH